jgi:hypothetical protein
MRKFDTAVIAKKAFSNACRKIVGRQKGGVITRMCADLNEDCQPVIDPRVPTANWHWDGKRHVIKCGTSLDQIANASTVASDAKLKRFTEAVIRHETEHGRLTDRSDDVPNACQSHDIPFRLWNLFEDVRIEYASATRKGGDGAFRWINFQDVEDSYTSAVNLLLACKLNEAGIKKSPSSAVPKWMGAEHVMYKGKLKKTRLVVLDFYRRACACVSSMSLLPVILEWIDIFGKEAPAGGDASINGVTDPNDKDTLIQSDRKDNKTEKLDDDQHPENKPAGRWSSRPNKKMNHDQISRIARAMGRVMTNAKVVKNRLNCNGHKLNANQAMQGSEKVFQTRGRQRGKRSLTLIVDMSGSMDYTYTLHGGKEFILAFRKLAKQGKIDLNILLTQNWGGSKSASYRIKSTDTDEWINSLRPDGHGERIMHCMKRFDRLIKSSTTSVIFTDADLTDSDIDITMYRQKGYNTIGAYIEAHEENLEVSRREMNEHFARSAIATEPVELAQRLMREILKD